MGGVPRQTKECKCRRQLADAETHLYISGTKRYTRHLCECGEEWTTIEVDDHEPVDPVTSGEVISVHEFMNRDLTISELLAPPIS